MVKKLNNYNDFRKVFKIFETEPFWEKWSEELIREEYDEFQSIGGIYAKYDIDDIMGIITLIYGARSSHPVTFEDPSKAIYISDLAVLHEYRGKGVGSELAEIALMKAYMKNNINWLYLRTNLEGSMSENIFSKLGFEIMKDQAGKIITQDVQFPRCIEGVSDTDVRKFMLKRIK